MSYWEVSWKFGKGAHSRAFPTEALARDFYKKLEDAKSFVRCSYDHFLEIEEKRVPQSGEESREVKWSAHPLRQESEAFPTETAALEFARKLSSAYSTLGNDEPRNIRIIRVP